MTAQAVFLYVTTPNSETAARIGRALVEEKLAACVNIHAEMRSVYEWNGEIEFGLETPLIVKTTAAQADAARDRVLALHPDDVPCVAALPVSASGSNAAFLQWIGETTSA
ncbi:divalent-cation tolerance protein CutA [Hyphococcus sp.]|uniref:divalent-cation tolerance protein CutA n=1 Tax=Hyphococcus sp. TaxID=2038636 RepID=UPI003CCBDA34